MTARKRVAGSYPPPTVPMPDGYELRHIDEAIVSLRSRAVCNSAHPARCCRMPTFATTDGCKVKGPYLCRHGHPPWAVALGLMVVRQRPKRAPRTPKSPADAG